MVKGATHSVLQSMYLQDAAHCMWQMKRTHLEHVAQAVQPFPAEVV